METLTKHSCLPKSSLVFAKSVEIKLIDREEIYFSTLQPSNLSLSQIFHCSLSFEMCVEIDKHWILSQKTICIVYRTINLYPKETLKENAMPHLEFDLQMCIQTTFSLVSKENQLFV